MEINIDRLINRKDIEINRWRERVCVFPLYEVFAVPPLLPERLQITLELMIIKVYIHIVQPCSIHRVLSNTL